MSAAPHTSSAMPAPHLPARSSSASAPSTRPMALCGFIAYCNREGTAWKPLYFASCWVDAPRWGGRQRCWLAPPLLPPRVHLGLLPACGAGCHPESPFCLSEFSVGQRDISAHTIQLLVPVTLNNKLYRCSSTYFSTSAGPLSAPATLAPAAHSTAASLPRRTSLRSTAASATTEVCQA
jgi:hypothetical protein